MRTSGPAVEHTRRVQGPAQRGFIGMPGFSLLGDRRRVLPKRPACLRGRPACLRQRRGTPALVRQ